MFICKNPNTKKTIRETRNLRAGTLQNYYEYRVDKYGTPVLIEGLTGDFELIKLSLMSIGSDCDTVYQAETVYELEILDKPLLATNDLGTGHPKYGIKAAGKTYGIFGKDNLRLSEIKTIPAK